MLRVGVIGLGAIAEKAYLPVITRRNLEIHLCTRNVTRLKQVAAQYRLNILHRDVESLIDSGIQAAFVHTSTAAHEAVVTQLLSNGIHVYVDKPVTSDFPSTEKLYLLAGQKRLLLHAGFNRRLAPAYQQLKTMQDPAMIIMQKNRTSLPGEVRTFIFDDFIHVVDTMLFFLEKPIDQLNVSGKRNGSKLQHVVLQATTADGTTAIGIMNRDSAATEERLEVFTPLEKRVVENMTETTIYRNGNRSNPPGDGWASTLFNKGFDQIVDHFLSAVESGVRSEAEIAQTLNTHRICEQVVRKLEGEKV